MWRKAAGQACALGHPRRPGVCCETWCWRRWCVLEQSPSLSLCSWRNESLCHLKKKKKERKKKWKSRGLAGQVEAARVVGALRLPWQQTFFLWPHLLRVWGEEAPSCFCLCCLSPSWTSPPTFLTAGNYPFWNPHQWSHTQWWYLLHSSQNSAYNYFLSAFWYHTYRV